MKTRLPLAGLLLPLLLTAEPWAPVPVWPGPPPAETLTMKPGADPRGTITIWTVNLGGGDWLQETHRGEVFIPEFVVWPAGKPNSPLIIICPGGGYNILAETHEGVTVAQRLNAQGVGAVVLRYRVPRRDKDKPWVVPVLDARKTLEIVRARASEWNADPKKIGILGFSAGGNLAARIAYSPADEGAARPDFVVMVYPAYLFEKDKPDSVLRAGPDGVVPVKSPQPVPAFFAHSADDPYPAEGSMALAAKIKSLGGSAEVHVWSKGGHGWGASDRCLAAKEWTNLLGAWLRDRGILSP